MSEPLARPSRKGRSARKAARKAEFTPRLGTICYGINPVELVSSDELERISSVSLDCRIDRH